MTKTDAELDAIITETWKIERNKTHETFDIQAYYRAIARACYAAGRAEAIEECAEAQLPMLRDMISRGQAAKNCRALGAE